ncbi:VENN motif pre-toxin domain-containing protein [Cedecea lapagei]|uniref:VENN motif pre-toxin domain-containing protein n=1 Tax=Cedecea lapagei TaxID=158823 RepID=UPI001E5DE2BE|nr:VENN motif pre-toxin domain-containing protein [Cedecea lapagei]
MVSTYGDTQALEAVGAKGGDYANMSAEALRNTADYQKAFGDYGIGGKYQMVAQSVSGILAGAAGGDLKKALAGGLNPVMEQAIKSATTRDNEVNEPANLMAHAVWGALAAQLSGGNAAAGAAGAFSGELAARHIAAEMFPGKDPGNLTQDQKQLVSLLGTMAAGIAGGVVGNSTTAATTGAQAGKNAVENNSLSAKDEKQRQDAKWSLPYIKDAGEKAKAEKLVADLDAKDKAFDVALDKACNGLSSSACQGMRQELAAMGKSYDEQMDGQYVGTMGSVYKEGADKIAGQQWQYATADAKAQRDADVQRIAQNWGVSPETAATLYDGMTVVHSTAAVAGAVYGMTETGSAIAQTDRIKGNIATSQQARESSNFAIHSAKSDQLQWGYTADDWNMGGLKAGDKVFGGIPGQSAYYTNESTLVNSGLSRESLFKSLQVSPHPEFGYRPKMGVYEVMNDIEIPMGTVSQNPLLGPGGGTQFFIKDYNSSLKLIDTIDLGK